MWFSLPPGSQLLGGNAVDKEGRRRNAISYATNLTSVFFPKNYDVSSPTTTLAPNYCLSLKTFLSLHVSLRPGRCSCLVLSAVGRLRAVHVPGGGLPFPSGRCCDRLPPPQPGHASVSNHPGYRAQSRGSLMISSVALVSSCCRRRYLCRKYVGRMDGGSRCATMETSAERRDDL